MPDKSRDTYGWGFTGSDKIVHTSIVREVNYEAWAVDLCTLLDKIELMASDRGEDEVARVCRMRFDIAREHGLTVVFHGARGAAP